MTAPRAISPVYQRAVWALLGRRMISHSEAVVLWTLCSFASHEVVYASVQTIATRGGFSKRQMGDNLRELVRREVLSRTKMGGQRPDTYSLAALTTLVASGAAIASRKNRPARRFSTSRREATIAANIQTRQKDPLKQSAPPTTQRRSLAADPVASAPAPQGVVGRAVDEADVAIAAASEPLRPSDRERRAGALQPRLRTPAGTVRATAAPCDAGGRRAQECHTDVGALDAAKRAESSPLLERPAVKVAAHSDEGER